MKEALYYHFIYFGIEKTVFDSQVVVPALKLRERAIPIQLIILETFSTWLTLFRPSVRAARKNRLKGLSVRTGLRFPRNFFGLNTLMVVLLIGPDLLRRRVVIQARGLQGTDCLIPIKKLARNLRIICDVRGVESEEYAYHPGKTSQPSLSYVQRSWRRDLERLSIKAIDSADGRFMVSPQMKSYFTIKGAHAESWIYVPCCLDSDRYRMTVEQWRAYRAESPWPDRLVAVFSGALSAWQKPELAVDLFKMLREINPRWFFLGLTPQTDRLTDLLQKAGVPSDDFETRWVPFQHIPKWLVQSDAGFLLRDDHPVNHFSCPTKLAEYLAAGLPLIATESVWQASQVIKEEKVGTILPVSAPADKLKSTLCELTTIVETERENVFINSQRAAFKRFAWDVYLPQMTSLFNYLAAQETRSQ